MYIKYELWETETGPMLFQATNANARKALKTEHRRICLMVFTAKSWDEACQKMYDHFEYGIYKPFDLIKSEPEIEDVCA